MPQYRKPGNRSQPEIVSSTPQHTHPRIAALEKDVKELAESIDATDEIGEEMYMQLDVHESVVTAMQSLIAYAHQFYATDAPLITMLDDMLYRVEVLEQDNKNFRIMLGAIIGLYQHFNLKQPPQLVALGQQVNINIQQNFAQQQVVSQQNTPLPQQDMRTKNSSTQTPFTQAIQAIDTPDMSDTVSGVLRKDTPDMSMVDTLFTSQDFRRDVQTMTKPQLIKRYDVSDSTIVRVKRMLRKQGFNI